jgi:uncharacterized membrane protein
VKSAVATIVSLALCLAMLGVPGRAAAAGPHGHRLDPAERDRLRGDLRQQAFQERMQLREQRAAGRLGEWTGEAGAMPGRGPMAGHPPQAGGWAAMPDRGPAPAGGGFMPGPGRLSPDERQMLRQQLRESRRRGGIEGAGGP